MYENVEGKIYMDVLETAYELKIQIIVLFVVAIFFINVKNSGASCHFITALSADFCCLTGLVRKSTSPSIKSTQL